MPPPTPENLDQFSKTQPTRSVPRGDSLQTLEQLAETQPIKRFVRPENSTVLMPENRSTVEHLAEDSLNFLDRLAIKLTQTKDGKNTGYLKQTFLEAIGIPTALTAGDVMGFLRGYLNLRQGRTVRGAAEVITAILPGVPTGISHKLIDMIDKLLEQESK